MKWALAAVALSACTGTTNQSVLRHPSNEAMVMPADKTASGLLVKLERTSCFGTCPAYIVEVDRSGSVGYEGRANVCTPGRASDRVSTEIIAELRQAITDSRFRETSERCCDCPVADAPSAVITVADGAQPKTIVVSDGCAGPSPVRALADKFDVLLNTERWIGTRENRKKCLW